MKYFKPDPNVAPAWPYMADGNGEGLRRQDGTGLLGSMDKRETSVEVPHSE